MTQPTVVQAETQMVTYDVTAGEIEAVGLRFAGLSAETPEGYEKVRLAIGECRETRTRIEKRRVELKAESLEWGRRVDAEAKRLTALLLQYEEPLKLSKAKVDDAKELARKAAEEAERKAQEESIRVAREAEEARLATARAAEEKRLAAVREEQRLEREQLDAERRAIDEAQRKADEVRRAEQKKIDDERRDLDAEKARIAREEEARQAVIRAEAAAKAKADREAREAEERAARAEAIRPDVEKVHAFAQAINRLKTPSVDSIEAKAAIADARTVVLAVARKLEDFGKEDITP